MMLKLVLFTLLLAITTGFACTAVYADPSYYQKYQSARRNYQMPQPPSGVDWTFNVQLNDYTSLSRFERVEIVGDIKALGNWSPKGSVALNRTDRYNVWSGTINVPANTTIMYRYFISAVDDVLGGIQIRRWESHMNARVAEVKNVHKGSSTDEFGVINDVTSIKRGWLNSGNILQFKLFRNPIQLYDSIQMNKHKISIKVVPVEYQDKFLTPILPSGRANTEYVRMRYGDSLLKDQPEYGVPYEEDDIVVFHTTLSDLSSVAFLVKVYQQDIASKNELVHLMGYQYIYPDFLNGTEGSFSVKLLSPTWLSAIGVINMQYLVVKPLPEPLVDFRTSFSDYWRPNWTGLHVGHRGLGKSLKSAALAAPITENTLASMKESASLGTDLVEFDVQLTSDYIPIIYHDYVVYVCMDPKTPKTKDDLTQVLIKDLTYEQLTALTTYQVIGTKIIEYPAHNIELREDYRMFPLFEDFLTQIDPKVGFDIEIKWPQQRSTGEYESVQTIEKNLYVDRILDVMLKKGCGRFSFFTSFDADICTMLRYKQNMYPVMFLSPSKENNYVDPRSNTIRDVVNNAQAFDFMGVVPHASFIAKDTNWVKVATEVNKKVFLWGDDINSTQAIQWFKETGPNGLIYDRLDLWLPKDHQNVFELETDLSELFKQQCFQNSANEKEDSEQRELSNIL